MHLVNPKNLKVNTDPLLQIKNNLNNFNISSEVTNVINKNNGIIYDVDNYSRMLYYKFINLMNKFIDFMRNFVGSKYFFGSLLLFVLIISLYIWSFSIDKVNVEDGVRKYYKKRIITEDDIQNNIQNNIQNEVKIDDEIMPYNGD